ncbi:hypothetical protein IE53DRAFT_222877 [Violaceomyces palustris]|uniref:Uncharacterized protein n=1 Tax=Violaceomyces palustris TaxID=1673888 RepID=A0ACD0P4T0_9BASI|nr:hypothetical protein IE53DRAFT_222877 [Violaceomyces palustris]
MIFPPKTESPKDEKAPDEAARLAPLVERSRWCEGGEVGRHRKKGSKIRSSLFNQSRIRLPSRRQTAPSPRMDDKQEKWYRVSSILVPSLVFFPSPSKALPSPRRSTALSTCFLEVILHPRLEIEPFVIKNSCGSSFAPSSPSSP